MTAYDHRSLALCAALLAVSGGVTACGGQPASRPAAVPAAVPVASCTSGGGHVVPHGLVHVALRGEDEAPVAEVDLATIVAERDRVEHAFRVQYRDSGHRRWFFRAFDRCHLVFVVARWQPHPPPLAGGTYVIERRLRVARSARAAAALGVAELLRQYEVGVGGVRAGMTPAEVEARLGRPPQVQQLGPFGAFDYVYPTLCVRFLGGTAAHLWPREGCVR